MFTPPAPRCGLDALNHPSPDTPQSVIGSFGIRYVLNTARCPGPPTHDTARSPRHVMPAMFDMHSASESGGFVPGVVGDRAVMQLVETHARSTSASAGCVV